MKQHPIKWPSDGKMIASSSLFASLDCACLRLHESSETAAAAGSTVRSGLDAALSGFSGVCVRSLVLLRMVKLMLLLLPATGISHSAASALQSELAASHFEVKRDPTRGQSRFANKTTTTTTTASSRITSAPLFAESA